MMGGEAPRFWWRDPSWQSFLLAPFAAGYGAAARWKLDNGERADIGLPVICIGNLTAGGGGKTPTALALGRAAQAIGLKPGFLSRGHGGALAGPVLVDPVHHSARDVGDEPMLLADLAPTAIAIDRKRAAALLSLAGCDLVIMDDGFQSARLHADFTVLAVDAGRGLGNGKVIPAGPLRAPLVDQVRHADALLVIGAGDAGGAAVRSAARGGKPVFEAHLVPEAPERFAGRRLLAFAGIADPRKLYRSLAALGAEVVATRDFPDHHPFAAAEIADLDAAAARDGLTLVTTRKDAARLDGGNAAARGFAGRVEVLDVRLEFAETATPERFLREALAAFRRRTIG
jgi:tetraacyldisaccharide 4'-kinase